MMKAYEEFFYSLCKNFDSFLPHHNLRDAEGEYASAIYRFREERLQFQMTIALQELR